MIRMHRIPIPFIVAAAFACPRAEMEDSPPASNLSLSLAAEAPAEGEAIIESATLSFGRVELVQAGPAGAESPRVVVLERVGPQSLVSTEPTARSELGSAHVPAGCYSKLSVAMGPLDVKLAPQHVFADGTTTRTDRSSGGISRLDIDLALLASDPSCAGLKVTEDGAHSVVIDLNPSALRIEGDETKPGVVEDVKLDPSAVLRLGPATP